MKITWGEKALFGMFQAKKTVSGECEHSTMYRAEQIKKGE